MSFKKTLAGLSLVGILTVGIITPIHAKETTIEQRIEKSFPDKQIRDIENFRQYTDDIMHIIAKKMGYEIDEKIPKPKIITSDEITLKEFNKLLGYDDNFFIGMFPYYFHKENMILLPFDRKLDSLAHELVHYFQDEYGHEDFEISGKTPNYDLLSTLKCGVSDIGRQW